MQCVESPLCCYVQSTFFVCVDKCVVLKECALGGASVSTVLNIPLQVL